MKDAAGADGPGGEESVRPLLTEQLQSEALEAAGHVRRSLAGALRVPALPPRDECSRYGAGRLLRGHRLAATAVALSDDSSAAFTATKCGALLKWDLETGRRCAPPPPAAASGWLHVACGHGHGRARLRQ